jgi:hypothetical protein
MSFNDGKASAPVISVNGEIFDIVKHETDTTYKDKYGIKSGSTALSSLPGYASSIQSLKLLPQYIVKRPIYSDEYMNRLSNAALFDDVISAALDKLAYFTLGVSDEIRGILYPESVRPLKSELEAKNALKEIKIIKNALGISNSIVSSFLSDQEIDQFEKYIHYTDKIAKLGSFLKKNFKAAHVFGRSASYIEYTDTEIPDLGIKAGSPIGLKPLKSQLLGHVVLNKETWEMNAVEYRDPTLKFKEYVDLGVKQQQLEEEQAGLIRDTGQQIRYIDSNNILYFVKNNNNFMRDDDDFWFGHSTLQSILPLSEENRRLNSIVIPAINQGMWAGTIIWTFPGYTESQMRQFFSFIKPGGHIGVGDDRIKHDVVDMKYDLTGLLNLKNELKRQIMSAFSIPSFLMNFENVTNRATAETVLIGFNESTIQAERSWISDILDDQWYPKLFAAYWPDDEFIDIKMKINIEFSNVAFESFLEKAVAIVALMEKGLLTLTEARNILKLPPLLPEDYASLGIKPPVDLQGAQQFEIPQTPNLVSQLGQMNNKAQAQQQQQGNTPSSKNSGGLSKTELQKLTGKAGISGLDTSTSLSSMKRNLLSGSSD